MKYYCLDQSNCGNVVFTEDPEEFRDLVCPICYGIILPYDDYEHPSWTPNQQARLIPVHPDITGSADAEKES